MDINWVEIVLAAGVLYGVLKLEYYYKAWRWKHRKVPPKLVDDIGIKGTVKNAADPIVCARCRNSTKSYAVYADESTWCMNCHEFED